MTNALPAVIRMHRWGEVEPGVMARLNGPDLKSKLAQYPGGTKFWLNIFGPPDRVGTVHAAITETAAEHGFELAQPEPVN
jgi:hypothetical protein